MRIVNMNSIQFYSFVEFLICIREKGRDLTQSYDKSPSPTEKSKRQRENTNTLPKTLITQRLRIDL